jgi:multimeric flavodoxin WrbA
MALINEMKKYLQGEVKVVSAFYDNIAPCTDCRDCWKTEGCSIRDDMQEIYRDLNEFDNVIIASPLYFSELTGPLLSLASRLQTYYAAKFKRKAPVKLKPKYGALIITGGGDGTTEKAESTARALFRMMNVTSIGNIFSLKTDDLPAADDTMALEEAHKTALRLNELFMTGGVGHET